MAKGNQAVLDAVAANEGYSKRVVLPESYYIARLSQGGEFEPSRNKGTPGLPLLITVTDGPFAGSEIAVTQWFSGKMVDLLKHLTYQVTGNNLNGAVLDEYGFEFTDGGDFKDEFNEQFTALDPEQRVDLMGRMTYCEEWDGKTVVVQIGLEDREFERDGEVIAFQDNRLMSIFGLKHMKRGKAYVVKTCHPLQTEAAAAMA